MNIWKGSSQAACPESEFRSLFTLHCSPSRAWHSPCLMLVKCIIHPVYCCHSAQFLMQNSHSLLRSSFVLEFSPFCYQSFVWCRASSMPAHNSRDLWSLKWSYTDRSWNVFTFAFPRTSKFSSNRSYATLSPPLLLSPGYVRLSGINYFTFTEPKHYMVNFVNHFFSGIWPTKGNFQGTAARWR